MKQQLEIEFKTLVDKEQFDRIAHLYRPLLFLKQHNYYYNSPFSDYSFRVRVKEEQKIFTLKQRLDDRILEHEKAFTGHFYEDAEIRNVLNRLNIFPPFSLEGELITYRATVENNLAELCLDINCYNSLIDYEIEYEMKKDHDGLKAFEEILSAVGIRYEPSYASKYYRCISTKE
ncbi:MAG TPA: CYTH domain-containing protein [Erysipelotrichaceae bacterium]|nr:CYTH domain-containing protein [Erysipelotrichaceae bacterium]HQB32149.1 CYTH domain-containing protein [Erysipelotrichaceae bacterium]